MMKTTALYGWLVGMSFLGRAESANFDDQRFRVGIVTDAQAVRQINRDAAKFTAWPTQAERQKQAASKAEIAARATEPITWAKRVLRDEHLPRDLSASLFGLHKWWNGDEDAFLAEYKVGEAPLRIIDTSMFFIIHVRSGDQPKRDGDWKSFIDKVCRRYLREAGKIVGSDYLMFLPHGSFNLDQLAWKLKQPSNAPLTYLRGELSHGTLVALTNYQRRGMDYLPLEQALVPDLNRLICGPSIYAPQRFTNITLRPQTHQLLAKPPAGKTLMLLNRLLLEDAFPQEIPQNPGAAYFSVRIASDTGLVNVQIYLPQPKSDDWTREVWCGGNPELWLTPGMLTIEVIKQYGDNYRDGTFGVRQRFPPLAEVLKDATATELLDFMSRPWDEAHRNEFDVAAGLLAKRRDAGSAVEKLIDLFQKNPNGLFRIQAVYALEGVARQARGEAARRIEQFFRQELARDPKNYLNGLLDNVLRDVEAIR